MPSAMPCAPTNPTPLAYTYTRFAQAKAFVFGQWCALAHERQQPVPTDLSGACKYGSLFMREVFGGVVEGHYAHQYNRIGGRLVDLSHDAIDVGAMANPYLHEAAYFEIPEYRVKWMACAPRVERWAQTFVRECRARGDANA